MSVETVIAAFDVAIALVTGYWGLQMMFIYSGGRFFWWPLTTFGASVVLLAGSILLVLPRTRKGWLIASAGVIPLVVWVALIRDFSWTYGIFAATVVLFTWATMVLSSAFKRNGFAPFAASLMLAIAWLPSSVNAFRAYLFPDPPFRNPPVLLPLLVLWALIAASIVMGAILFWRSGLDELVR